MRNTAELEENLDLAIRRLYDVMKDYRGRDCWVEYLSEGESSIPTVRPVSKLTDEQVCYYLHGVYCCRPGDEQWEHANLVAVIKYFIPRLLEAQCRGNGLGASGYTGLFDEEWWIAENMNKVEWREWPANERDAVEEVLIAWCELRFQPASEPNYAFDFLMDVGIPIAKLLVIAKKGSTAAIAKLINNLLFSSMNELTLCYRLWPEDKVNHEEQLPFVRWMMHPHLTGRLEARFLEEEADEHQQRAVSEVVQGLDHVREKWRQADDAPKWVRALLDE